MPEIRPKFAGKGGNPNSHGNNQIGEKPAVRHDCWMSEEQWEFVKEFGNGNYSRGVRWLVEKAMLVIDN